MSQEAKKPAPTSGQKRRAGQSAFSVNMALTTEASRNNTEMGMVIGTAGPRMTEHPSVVPNFSMDLDERAAIPFHRE